MTSETPESVREGRRLTRVSVALSFTTFSGYSSSTGYASKAGAAPAAVLAEVVDELLRLAVLDGCGDAVLASAHEGHERASAAITPEPKS